jgi:outer membrane protein TolC
MAPLHPNSQRPETRSPDRTTQTITPTGVPAQSVADGTAHAAVSGPDRPTATAASTPAPLYGYCLLLEARVDTLEARLDQRDRQLEEVRTRYEAILADRDDGKETGGLVASWLPLD